MAIRAAYQASPSTPPIFGGLTLIGDWSRDGGLLWVDITATDADATRQLLADTLAFPTRQSARVSAHREVVEAYVVKEPQTFADFLNNRAGDFLFLLTKRLHDAADPRISFFDRS